MSNNDNSEKLSDSDAVLLLQNILLSGAEGKRDDESNAQFRELRRWLFENEQYAELAPRFLRTCRDLNSFWAYIKDFDPQWEPRRRHIRESFERLLDEIEAIEFHQIGRAQLGVASSAWTGVRTTAEKVRATKTLMPVALAGIDNLIASLEEPKANGAPLLDSHAAAIENLRSLHEVLGEILDEVSSDSTAPFQGEGLVNEASKFAKRAARELKSDPMPYAAAGMLLAVLTAMGFPGIGGYLSGVALCMRQNTSAK